MPKKELNGKLAEKITNVTSRFGGKAALTLYFSKEGKRKLIEDEDYEINALGIIASASVSNKKTGLALKDKIVRSLGTIPLPMIHGFLLNFMGNDFVLWEMIERNIEHQKIKGRSSEPLSEKQKEHNLGIYLNVLNLGSIHLEAKTNALKATVQENSPKAKQELEKLQKELEREKLNLEKELDNIKKDSRIIWEKIIAKTANNEDIKKLEKTGPETYRKWFEKMKLLEILKHKNN